MSNLFHSSKRFFAVILSLVIVIGMFPITVFAEGEALTITVLDESNAPLSNAEVEYTVFVDESESKKDTVTSAGDGKATIPLADFVADIADPEKAVSVKYTVSKEGYVSKENSVCAITGNNQQETVKLSLVPSTDVTFTVTKTGEGTVKINGSEVTGSCKIDKTADGDVKNVTIAVSAAANYRISSVTIAGAAQDISDNSSFSVTLDSVSSDTEIAVVFLKESKLSATINGNGSVFVNEVAVPDEGLTIVQGETLALSVTPDEGYQISSVAIDGTSQTVANKDSFTKNITVKKANISVEATFVKVYTVTVDYESDKGAVITSPEGTAGSVTVETGTIVNITATPNPTYRIAKIEINNKVPEDFSESAFNEAGKNYEASLTANKNYTVKVTFAPLTYDVSIEATTNGTVAVNKNTVDYGQSVVVTVTPKAGYTIDTAKVNNNSVYSTIAETENDSVFTFSIDDIQEDKTIAVTFKECETTTMANVSWNSADALRKDGNLYVFAKNDTVTFRTTKQGIRVTDKDGNIYGNKNTNTVTVSNSTTIKKIELRYDFGWHEVLVSDSSVTFKLVFDAGKPVASIKANSEPNANGYYNSNVTLSISAKDNGDYSGIASLEYRITYNEETSEWMAPDEHTDNGGKRDATITLDTANYNSDDVIVEVRAKDKAGNNSDATDNTVIHLNLCSTSPVASVKFTDERKEAATDNWFNGRKLTLTVTEDRDSVFDENAANNIVKITAKDSHGTSVAPVVSVVDWAVVSTDGNRVVKQKVYTFAEEYTYQISYNNYTNKADLGCEINISGDYTDEFAIDATAPTGEIKSENKQTSLSRVLDYITFGLFSNEGSVDVICDPVDTFSGVQSVRYYVTENTDVMAESTLDDIAEAEWQTEINIDADKLFIVYARVIDNAGNVKYIGSKGVIYDSKVADINFPTEGRDLPNEKGFYNVSRLNTYQNEKGETVEKGIRIPVTVTDPGADTKYYSGIRKIQYKVTAGADNKVTQEGVLAEFDIADPQQDELWLQKDVSVIIDASIKDNNTGNLRVEIEVTDNSGNKFTRTSNVGELNLDEMEGSVSVDGTPIMMSEANYGWYTTERTVTITISDRDSSFDADAAKNAITVTKVNEKGNELPIAEDEVQIEAKKLFANVYTVTVKFTGEGKYRWSFDYTNSAGNNLTTEELTSVAGQSPFAFTIDRTKPIASVSVSGNTWLGQAADSLLSVITFGLYNPSGFTMDVEAQDTDDVSPVKVEYYIHHGTDALSHSALDSLYNSPDANQFASELPELTGAQQFTVYARITDNAGNYIYVSSDGHVIDPTDTDLDIAAIEQPNENEIYGQDYVAPGTYRHIDNESGNIVKVSVNNGIQVSISAKEAESADESYSGIKEIHYEVKSRNADTESYNMTQSGTLYSFDYVRDSDANSNGGTLTITDVNEETATAPVTGNVPTKDMLCRDWSGLIIVDADRNNCCDVLVTVTVTDNAGNSTSKSIKLDVDITAPAINVAFDNNYVQNGSYFNDVRTATVTYTERTDHFDQAAAETIIKDNITATKLDKDVKVEDAYTISWDHDAGNANNNSDTHIATVAFIKDANYTFGASFTDKAGNGNTAVDIGDSAAAYNFTIDRTTPEGSVTVNGWTWSHVLETLTFGLFSNSTATVSVSAHDDISPVKVEYYKSNDDIGKAEESLSKLTLTSTGDFSDSKDETLFEISQTEQFNVYVKVTDCAGNIVWFNSDGYIVDQEESAVAVTAVDLDNGNGYYGIANVVDYSSIGEAKQGIKVHIDANETDETVNSGIASIKYEVIAELEGKEKVTQSGVLYSFDYSRTAGENSNGGKLVVTDANSEKKESNGTVPAKGDLRTSWSGDIIVDAAKNNSCNVKVRVTVVDNAGNTNSATHKLDVDITPPTINVTFDNNTALNDYYFAAPRTATVVITERSHHFNSTQATENIVNLLTAKTHIDDKDLNEDLKNSVSVSGWSEKKDTKYPDKTTWTTTVSFPNDGAYTFGVEYTDLAGNANVLNDPAVNIGDSVAWSSFVVDTTLPDAEITVNEHSWDKILSILTFGLYSKTKAEVKVEATDKTSPITIEYYKTNDPIVKTSNALDELYKEGKFISYSAFTVNADEQFVVYVRITDNAGNYKYISSDGYIVDLTGPNITLTPDEPNKNNTYNKDVNIKIETSDDEPYSGIAKVEYWVVSKDKKTQKDKETQRQTLFTFDYTREEGINTNNGTLVITDIANGTDETLTGNVPTQEQLYAEWTGVFTVDASLNDSSDVKAFVGVTDNAGNYTEKSVSLDIDITDPVIKVTYEGKNNDNAVDGYYTERTATVAITERTNHFDASAATNGIKITAVDAKGAEVETAYSISSWTTVEGATPDDAVHTATISYIADANYTFKIAYTDKADNENMPVDVSGQKNPYEFTVDKTAPIGTVTAKSAEKREETWENDNPDRINIDELTFGFWSNTKISISGTSDDATSPIQSVEYYMPVSEIASDKTTILSPKELDAIDSWKTFEAFDVTENTQFTVYLRITDNAGNYTYVASNGLIVDEEHPVEESVAPEISVTPAKPINGIYKDDVRVAIEVVDPMVGGTYSGLKEVRYAVFDRDSATPNKATQEGTLFTFDMDYPKQSDLKQKWTGEITVAAAKNNSNNIQIVVYAKDNSLNTVDNSQVGSKSYTVIKIDTTAPVIDISYDNNSADSGTYFKANRTATVTVTERNFKAEDVKVTITNTDGVIPSVVGWSHTTGSYSKDNATHSATITYSADGDYTFAIEYTDLAGNKCTSVNYASGTVAGTAFTVDKTLPTISVSYDNNSAANDKYFKANRTATVTVVEHNFSTDRVVFTQTASLSGSNISIPGASWSNNGDVHTAVISYTSDGDYTFDVTMTDLAGNASGEANYGGSVAAKAFTVDKTIVEPTIGGVENGVAYNEGVIPTISFTDVNFATYEIRLLRTRFGDKDVDVTAQFLKGDPRNGSGVSGSYDYFENIAENDGIYTLTLSVTDLAGNTSSSTRTFTVNRFGSVYVYDDYLISLIKDGGQYIKKQDGADVAITNDLVITEYNATRIAAGSLMVMITRNGEPIEAKYVSNPVASPDVAIGESGWFQYLYTINKDNFVDDGEYRITLSSKDSNDRTSTSVPENSIDTKKQAVKDTMNFTVDTTVPEIRNITIPDAKFHDDYAAVNATSIDVSYSIVDVGGLKSVEVKVNGESRGVNTDFGDSLNTYDGTFQIMEANDRQSIEIIVEDLAGNVTDTSNNDFDPGEAYDFRETILVSTNGFVRYYEDKGLFYGSLGGSAGAVAAAGLLVFILKRRKKSKAA